MPHRFDNRSTLVDFLVFALISALNFRQASQVIDSDDFGIFRGSRDRQAEPVIQDVSQERYVRETA